MTALQPAAVDSIVGEPVVLHWRKRADTRFSRKTGIPVPAACGLWAVAQPHPPAGAPTIICPSCRRAVAALH